MDRGCSVVMEITELSHNQSVKQHLHDNRMFTVVASGPWTVTNYITFDYCGVSVKNEVVAMVIQGGN